MLGSALPVSYSSQAITVRRTAEFLAWVRALRDPAAKARIAMRIERLEQGLFGDAKPVGAGVAELRIDYGPGYRVSFIRRGSVVVVLLCGGDKRTQARDIARAIALAAELED